MTIDQIIRLRRGIDGILYSVEEHLSTRPEDGREMALVRTKLQEAKMWAGQALGVRGSELPEKFRDFSEERLNDRTRTD